jgi:hypothetical protein
MVLAGPWPCPRANRVIIGAVFSRGTNGDNFQDMLGSSLIWLLMRLLEHPHVG